MRESQVSGGSVFWRVERSGILQNIGGRKVGRGPVADGTLLALVVVVETPTVHQPATVLGLLRNELIAPHMVLT
jgi:hypothetical protein